MTRDIIPIGHPAMGKPEPITIPAAVPALPERRTNPLAVWKRNFVPEQDRMWVEAMKALERKRRGAEKHAIHSDGA